MFSETAYVKQLTIHLGDKGYIMITVLCDVDGTLIDEKDNFRPFAAELLTLLNNKQDINLYVWSAGGLAYARIKAERILYNSHFTGVRPPVVVPKGMKTIENVDLSCCYFIDDAVEMIADKLKKGAHGYHVPYYAGPAAAPLDDVLYQVYRDILTFEEEVNGKLSRRMQIHASGHL